MEKIKNAIKTGRQIGRMLIAEEKPDSPEIEKWREENSEADALLDDIATPEGLGRRLTGFRSRDGRDGYRTFRDNIARRRRRRILRVGAVAAAAACIVAAGIFVAWRLGDGAELNLQPGSAYAYLVGGDGQTIDLGAPLSIDSGNTRIVNDPSGSIRYETDGAEAAEEVANILVVPRRGEYSITLSDGTEVWLNSESRLSYPVAFTGSVRRVVLEGEAYFEVAHGSRPFIVSVAGMEVEVLGTSFNVMSYATDDIRQVTLAEGSVRVRAGDGEAILAPGQQASFDRNDSSLRVDDVNAELYTAWKNGEFIFNNEDLETVLNKLSRWFDVEFDIRSDAIRSLVFTGSLKRYTTLNEICDILSRSNSVDFIFADNKVVVREK
ncbi:DUF4974 domain-containing protein [Alistipes sp. OttesenSCG-928-B03]|nr:DUF4974 domain-containing protein [Alistipes sp. OttesenSCG-928-B03]